MILALYNLLLAAMALAGCASTFVTQALMRNPGTGQVVVCGPSPSGLVEQCAATLERQGWQRIGP